MTTIHIFLKLFLISLGILGIPYLLLHFLILCCNRELQKDKKIESKTLKQTKSPDKALLEN